MHFRVGTATAKKPILAGFRFGPCGCGGWLVGSLVGGHGEQRHVYIYIYISIYSTLLLLALDLTSLNLMSLDVIGCYLSRYVTAGFSCVVTGRERASGQKAEEVWGLSLYAQSYCSMYVYVNVTCNMYVHVHIYIYIHTYTYTYTIHTHIHMHIHIHMYIHIHIHITDACDSNSTLPQSSPRLKRLGAFIQLLCMWVVFLVFCPCNFVFFDCVRFGLSGCYISANITAPTLVTGY